MCVWVRERGDERGRKERGREREKRDGEGKQRKRGGKANPLAANMLVEWRALWVDRTFIDHVLRRRDETKRDNQRFFSFFVAFSLQVKRFFDWSKLASEIIGENRAPIKNLELEFFYSNTSSLSGYSSSVLGPFLVSKIRRSIIGYRLQTYPNLLALDQGYLWSWSLLGSFALG